MSYKPELDELMPLVYDELRRLAQQYLSGERGGHTLQTTALVHEAYLRLVDQKSVNWQNRAQFFGIAAQMMRRILINHARERNAQKRQGYATKISLDDAVGLFEKRELARRCSLSTVKRATSLSLKNTCAARDRTGNLRPVAGATQFAKTFAQ
jgi:RNA polymerase sigma factor (TIGR02999 family)